MTGASVVTGSSVATDVEGGSTVMVTDSVGATVVKRSSGNEK